jgi:hypothetical protein
MTGKRGVPCLRSTFESEQRGFRVDRVEYGLDEQHIDVAVHQTARLFVIGLDENVESGRAKRRVVDVGRH